MTSYKPGENICNPQADKSRRLKISPAIKEMQIKTKQDITTHFIRMAKIKNHENIKH